MKCFFLCVAIVFVMIECVYSQAVFEVVPTQDTNKRKTVGLVLSGGGAKGLAHIGVLKAFEQYGIPIDFIAGTSMGGIIGGLYASGYSPDEIEQIFYSEELNDWLARKIDDKYQYYYKLAEKDNALLKMGFDINKNFKADIPLSLINPVQMDFAFMQFFASADELCKGNYNDLMIPFFCVASDIANRKPSNQRSGSLSKSIRASMTFPFFFSPLAINGNLMCDGGLYNNFPSMEMNEFFSPDIMLGVKVVDNFDTPNDEDLVLYIKNMVTVDSKYEMPIEQSLIIEPNMKFVSIMDFTMKEQCIQRGYNTAVANIKKIKSLVKDSISIEERVAKRKIFNEKKKPLVIGNIIVHGVSRPVQTHIGRLMLMNIDKDSVLLDDLKFNYLSVASLDNIRNIEPSIYYDNFLKSYVLDLNIKTKNILQTKLGGMLSTEPISNLFLGLEYNFFHRYSYKISLNSYLGRYYTATNIYYRMDFPNRSLPFYLDMQLNYNRWNYFRNRNGLFEYSAKNYLIQRETNAQVRLGVPVTNRSKLVFRMGIGETNDRYFNDDIILSTDTNDITKFRNFVFATTLTLNSLDDNIFATDGKYIEFNIQYVRGKEKFYPGNSYLYDFLPSSSFHSFQKRHAWLQVDLETKIYHSISKYYSFGILTKTHYSFQELFSTQKASLLNSGYFAPTIETFTQFYPEYRSNQFFSVGMEQILKIGGSLLGKTSLRWGIYGYLPVREILANDYNQPYYGDLFHRIYLISALNLGFSTPIGNIVLSASYIQRDNTKIQPWNISLSFGKMLFNNKNIER
ncbi:MAG: patatin-like phospholipase family protein [Bacteroidales bacterium]